MVKIKRTIDTPPRRRADDPMLFPCPICGKEAVIAACESKRPSYHWRCMCGSRGFLPPAIFRALEREKKIIFPTS